MACFVLENLDVNIENKDIKTQISNVEKATVSANMERLKSNIRSMSSQNMTIDYEIINIAEPIQSVTYEEEHRILCVPI